MFVIHSIHYIDVCKHGDRHKSKGEGTKTLINIFSTFGNSLYRVPFGCIDRVLIYLEKFSVGVCLEEFWC